MRRVPVFGRLWRRAAWVLDWRFADLKRRIDAVGGRLAEIERTSADGLASTAHLTTELRALRDELGWLRAEVAEVGAAVTQVNGDVAALREHVSPVLRAIATRETANRERLEKLREEAAYAEPFEHPDPLVTVCIPTHDRVEMLTERSLPSVLAQTHRQLEVIVTGDASPPHVAPAVEALGDDRVRFVNLTHRHAVTDADRHWLVGSVPARNNGYALAKGHWIVDFDDDDAMRPEAIERVLAMARERRLEVVYGKLATHYADGRTEIVGRFPPTVHQFAWQGAVVHRDLRFFGRDLVAAAFDHPNDWFRAESMMRVGVHFGMTDEVLYDYYPARSWKHEADVPENAFINEHTW